MTLRKKWRIVGSFIGALPGYPSQNIQLGLPLELSFAEVRLLLDKDVCRLMKVVPKKPSAEALASYQAHKTKAFEEYKELVMEGRKQHIRDNASQIVERGRKRRKVEDEAKESDIIEAKLREVSVPDDQEPIHLHTRCPWPENLVEAALPEPSSSDQIKAAIFSDLWEKGYYMTNGFKFACDFLAYEGDPFLYHAKFMVVCKQADEDVRALELIIRGRLSGQVHKEIVLASVKEPSAASSSKAISLSSEVVYMSFKWKGRKRSLQTTSTRQ